MKDIFLIMFIVSSVLGNAQDPEFTPVPFSKLIAFAENETENEMIFEKVQFDIIYLDEEKDATIDDFKYLNKIFEEATGNPIDFQEFSYNKLLKCKAGNTILWLPFAGELVNEFKAEFDSGSNYRIYCIYVMQKIDNQYKHSFFVADFLPI